MSGWRDSAACLDHDPEMWFPPAGKPSLFARGVCQGCPVASECLQHAMRTEEHGHRYGLWGGLTASGRDVLARQMRAAAP